jgi:hypothetical protein
LPSTQLLFKSLYDVLKQNGFYLEDTPVEEVKPVVESNTMKNTKLLTVSKERNFGS